MFQRYACVRQDDPSGCGPVALATVEKTQKACHGGGEPPFW